MSVRCGVWTHALSRGPELKSGALDRSANLTSAVIMIEMCLHASNLTDIFSILIPHLLGLIFVLLFHFRCFDFQHQPRGLHSQQICFWNCYHLTDTFDRGTMAYITSIFCRSNFWFLFSRRLLSAGVHTWACDSTSVSSKAAINSLCANGGLACDRMF